MKKSLLLSITWITFVAVTATTLYAQTTTGTSILDKMKESMRPSFTLSADLNPGQTGYESAPVSGKKTGNMLTAAEWNRMLEIISQSSTGGGTLTGSDRVVFLDTPITIISSGNTTVDRSAQNLDLSTITGVTIPSGAKAVQLFTQCNNYTNENLGTTLKIAKGTSSLSSYHNTCAANGFGSANDVDTNSVIVPLASDGKSIAYSYDVPSTWWGQIAVVLTGYITDWGGWGSGTGTGNRPIVCSKTANSWKPTGYIGAINVTFSATDCTGGVLPDTTTYAWAIQGMQVCGGVETFTVQGTTVRIFTNNLCKWASGKDYYFTVLYVPL